MNNPKISVIIPLYNHEKYIQEAVYSVLEQTFSDFELIIINDGSKDSSEEVVKSIKDERIKYYYQENKGAHNTINRGIKLAKGEYICILNSDDIYNNSRIEMCLKNLDNNSSFSAVFSHIEFIDDQGSFIKYMKGPEDIWENYNPEISFKSENNILLDLLAGNFLITTSNLFCRKSVFQDIGFFQNLRYAHDYDFFLRLCYHFKVHIIDLPLIKYRVHSANTYNTNTKAETYFEVGLVLTNFFLNYDLTKVLPDDDIYINMVKFLNSINTFHSEMMIMTLLIFALNYKIHDKFFKEMTENSENPFRKIDIDHFKRYLNVWKEVQEAWNKRSDRNDGLIETDKKLMIMADEAKKWWSKWSETNERLIETTQQMQSLLNSRSYRLGSFLTWPIRKLLSLKKAL